MKVGPGIVYYSFNMNISALFFVIAKATKVEMLVRLPWNTTVHHASLFNGHKTMENHG